MTLTACNGSRRAAPPPRFASQKAASLYVFNQSIITPSITKSLDVRHLIKTEAIPDDPNAVVKALIPISIAGWLLMGVICILCINGKGKLGRWIPEWYLDSQGTRRDKAMVVLWWTAVIVLSPLILPVLLVRKMMQVLMKWTVGRKKKAKMLQRKETMEDV